MNQTTHLQRLHPDRSGQRLRWEEQRTVALLVGLGLVVLLGGRWYGGRYDLGEVVGEDAAVRFQVDINQAGPAELALLPGIGPTLARRIVVSRREQGRFLNAAGLQRVTGIGPRKVHQVTPYLVFRDRVERER